MLYINNISILLLIFIAVPLFTIYNWINFTTLIFGYIYLGVIIIFIIIGVIILNIKMNLILRPLIIIVFFYEFVQVNEICIDKLNFHGVIIIFITLLVLIFKIIDLFNI